MWCVLISSQDAPYSNSGWLRNAFVIISLKCSVLILLFLLLGRSHDARGLRPMRTPPPPTPLKVKWSTPLFMVSSGECSADPAISCASGRGVLRRAHISRSTRKRCGLGMPAPTEEGFREVSSDASCRFAISGRCSDCITRQSVAYRAPQPSKCKINLSYYF